MTLWYAQYDKTSKDVVGFGYVSNPEALVDDVRDVSVGFEGEPPEDLFGVNKTPNYIYNTETNLVEAKA